MGLLDDAIREHLELKRLNGTDPGVVAREEQNALGPVRRRGDPEETGEAGLSEPEGSALPLAEADPIDSSAGGQETVEINMEAELDTGMFGESAEGEQAAPGRSSGQTPLSAEDSLEWEVPSHRGEPADAPDPDDGTPGADDGREAGAHVEDVLEETPDFLRDTPEQERLWFEQRPPRDFDFNE
jgi:hypothetical protein